MMLLGLERSTCPRATNQLFDLDPDGEPVTLAVPAQDTTAEQDKVVIVFNFFDDLRCLAPVRRARFSLLRTRTMLETPATREGHHPPI